MASSAAVISPPPPKPSTSDVDADFDDDEYEIEYEEIEEEIEVEEEVEIEVEVEEEIEDEVDASRQENPKSDTGKLLELDEHKDQIQPSSLTDGVFVKSTGDVKTTDSNSKEEYVKGENISEYKNQKTVLNGGGEVNHAKITPSVGDVNATSIVNNASGENVNGMESNQSALEDVSNTSPRLHAAQIRFRDPSPSPEFGRESKKLRIVCEFHAKGWCIRGNSCRFLHIKDGPDAAMKRSEALGREASSSACVPPLQSEDKPKLNSPQDDTYMGAPTLEDRGRFKHKFYLDDCRYYNIPPLKGRLSARDSAYHGSSSMASHGNDFDTRVSGFGPRMDEIISKKSNIVPIDHRLADLADSYSRHPLTFGSSYCDSSSDNRLHNFLQSSLEHLGYASPSMQQSIPLGSRYESDTPSRNRILKEADPAKSEGTFSSFDWEPSLPFRPSHEITRNILLKEHLYNPVHENIDKKDVKDMRAKFSHSDQRSSIKNVNVKSKSPQEELKLLDKAFGGDTVKGNVLSSSNYDKVKHDETMDETVLEGDGSGTKDDMDGHFKRDGHVTHMQYASKAFKYFQSALIEFVKELVKPTWREGLLSKDAHKFIVKKAVDKVLSTLPTTDQIPTTAESVKLYLSTSQPKLAKLVEGYINIYGKT